MAKLNDVFPSKYMKAEVDVVEGEDIVLTIRTVEMEQFDENGRKVTKPVIYFRGTDKGMVCNKTNANTIAALYGDETDDWEGKPIGLCSMQVQGPSGMVDSIRVKKRAPKAPAASTKAAPAAMTEEEDEASKVPF